MKVVVDSNAMRSEALRNYLAARRSNRAVLIDYASVEAYKANPLVTIQRSMAILAEFPEQVLVLRGTGVIARQCSRSPDYVRRMIWDEYTAFFPVHAASIPYIGENEANMVAGALYLHGKAQDVLSLFSADRLREFQAATDEMFTREQLSELRRGYRSPETLVQMLEMAGRLAAYQLDDETVFGKHKLVEVLNHFHVRHVLARILLSVQWMLDGRPELRDGRLQNDQVDAVFAVYGTYFNGLMTTDKRAGRLHEELRAVLRALGPRGKGLILPVAFDTRAK